MLYVIVGCMLCKFITKVIFYVLIPVQCREHDSYTGADLQVFGNPSNMERLQNIVWPEIRLLAQQRISKLGQEGAESVVLEAAVLLEAGWDNLCDEIWTVQVSPDIARYVAATSSCKYSMSPLSKIQHSCMFRAMVP